MSKAVRSTRGGPFSFRRKNQVPPEVRDGSQPNQPGEGKPPTADNGTVGPNLPNPGNGGVGIPEVPTTPISPTPPPPGEGEVRIPTPVYPTPYLPAPAPTPTPKSALDQYREKMQGRLKDYQPGRPVQQQPAQTPSSGLIGGAMTDYSKPYSM